MHDQEDLEDGASSNRTDGMPPLFAVCNAIEYGHCPWISEYWDGEGKIQAMLPILRRSFSASQVMRIPFGMRNGHSSWVNIR